jgi:hypothetical protein
LRSGIEWADDVVTRLDEDETHANSEFHRRKAAWKRDVAQDEKPREILEQTRVARTYRVSGWLAIGIELIIATVTLFALLSFGFSFSVSLLLALVIATLVTVGIAYVLHGGITALVNRWGEPTTSYNHLKKWFILPSFVLMILALLAYVAVQRLDAESLYLLQPVLSVAKFAAMLGFMVLGTALLVAADLLDWSRSRAANYEAIRNERQRVASKRREWQEELELLEVDSAERESPRPSDEPKDRETSPLESEAHSNGNSSSVLSSAVKLSAALLVLVSVTGLSACSSQPQIRKVQMAGNVSYEIVVDASGITNSSALRQAGGNVIKSAPKIVELQHVNKLSVFWFGQNGWTAEEKFSLPLPPFTRAEVVKHDQGEVEKVRPDVREYGDQRDSKSLQIAEQQIAADYRREVEKALGLLTIDSIIPPPSVESPCTDLNGILSRFAEPTGGARIVLIITDGRQNCGGDYDIRRVLNAQNNQLVVVMIVPSTEADGREDFELRKSRFTNACPQCSVVPYYREDLDQVISNALRNRTEQTAVAEK